MRLALLVGVAALVAAAVGFEAWARARLARTRGRPAPWPAGGLGEAVRGDALLYFHQPGCSKCRAMAPAIDALAHDDPRVRPVDVRRHPEAARAFQVMATPTVIAVRAGHVVDARVGALAEADLRQMLSALGPAPRSGA